MSLHPDKLSWFRANQSLYLLFNSVCFWGEAANTNFIVWFDPTGTRAHDHHNLDKHVNHYTIKVVNWPGYIIILHIPSCRQSFSNEDFDNWYCRILLMFEHFKSLITRNPNRNPIRIGLYRDLHSLFWDVKSKPRYIISRSRYTISRFVLVHFKISIK